MPVGVSPPHRNALYRYWPATTAHNPVAMELRPGDMQFINNYHVMHGRTAYSDDRQAGSIRHLKRLWLETRVLEKRPLHFRNSASHWDQKRSASRLHQGTE